MAAPTGRPWRGSSLLYRALAENQILHTGNQRKGWEIALVYQQDDTVGYTRSTEGEREKKNCNRRRWTSEESGDKTAVLNDLTWLAEQYVHTDIV